MPFSRGVMEAALGGERTYGVIYGLTFRDPGSATLTATLNGGYARVKSTTLGKKYEELVVASTTKVFTASKDTYAFLKTDGTVAYIEVANAAAKPTQATVDAANGANSLWLAKVVTDGTRVVAGGVSDMRQEAAHGRLEIYSIDVSFETGEQAAMYIPVPYSGRVLYQEATAYKAIAGTDNATLTAAIGLNDVFTNVTGGVVTFTLSDAAGVRRGAVATAANYFRGGQEIRVTSAKTTAGGKAILNIVIEQSAR